MKLKDLITALDEFDGDLDVKVENLVEYGFHAGHPKRERQPEIRLVYDDASRALIIRQF